MPAERALRFSDILGKAKPIQPISSKNPAGHPNKTPIRKRPGVNAGDTKVFRQISTEKINSGGIARTAYQRTGIRTRPMREKSEWSPALPSIKRVRKIPEMLGP